MHKRHAFRVPKLSRGGNIIINEYGRHNERRNRWKTNRQQMSMVKIELKAREVKTWFKSVCVCLFGSTEVSFCSLLQNAEINIIQYIVKVTI